MFILLCTTGSFQYYEYVFRQILMGYTEGLS